MNDPVEGTRPTSAEELAEITGAVEEEDETGAPSDWRTLRTSILQPREEGDADESSIRVTALALRQDA